MSFPRSLRLQTYGAAAVRRAEIEPDQGEFP